MSKVKIQGNASGTGVLTVTAPNTSTDRTITLPDATGTLLNSDGDGSSLTGVGVAGITSSADATAITIDSSERVGIGAAPASGIALTISKDGTGADLAGIRLIDSNSGNDQQIYNYQGNLYFRDSTAGVTRLRVDADGLKFGNDTAAANALDDYEEGTFTATIGNATTSGGIDTGVYIRVGRLCHFQYYTGAMSFSNVGGSATIGGLPFTMESLHTAYSVFGYVHGDAITNCAGFHGNVNGTTLYAVQNDSTSYRPWVAGTKYCMVGGTYIIKEGS